jgi:FtsP/CotA-like multicopper oxidase with cupredoxin domain
VKAAPFRLALALLAAPCAGLAQDESLPEIATHDNRVPAGRLDHEILSLALETGTGRWRPENEGRGIVVQAFGEEGGSLQIPAPLIRVREGTELRVRILNRFSEPLVVHGLHTRPGAPGDTLWVAPGAAREARFTAGAPGTYLYWATTTGAAITDRMSEESQLGGAFVVDPASGPPPGDRVFVIGTWLDPEEFRLKGRFGGIVHRAVVVNGLSWPHTERFRYATGDSIRWRWINATDRAHPMHLHGSHFRVDSRGDAVRDTIYPIEARGLAVTELVPPAGSFTLLWVPERAGNWLFHCHTLLHIHPGMKLGRTASPTGAPHVENHALDGMAGLAVGVEVVSKTPAAPPSPPAPSRRIRLIATAEPGRYGTDPGYGFVLDGDAGPAAPRHPGPPLVLVRDEPVAITVVNRLAEPTSIHWHGIELESYYDGVAGWSGSTGRTAPAIAPGDSFVAYMAPPRAGTFIYHTHFDELRQLTSGLYGPLIVMEPGASLDPDTDRILVLSADGPGTLLRFLLDGSPAPEIELDAGTTYRLRIINIAPNGQVAFSLLDGESPASWTPVAKDGADLPPARRTPRPARQAIGVGETYDFAFTPSAPGILRIEVRQRGVLVLAGIVRISEPAPLPSRR